MGKPTIPRISGLLFNCSLNCALPTLLQNIEVLSTLEQEGGLPTEEGNPVYTNYNRLKTLFATYYGLKDPSLLNWEQFNSILVTHSFYATEMMFLPVFRNFISEKAITHGYHSDSLWCLKDIQSELAESDESLFWEDGINPAAGRYNQLDAREANTLFYRYLDIGPIQLHEHGEDNIYSEHDAYPLPLKDKTSWSVSAAPLSLYLKDGHFELQPHDKLAAATKEFTQEIDNLPEQLMLVHDTLTSSMTKGDSDRGLGYLFEYVNSVLRKSIYQMRMNEFCVSIEQYRELGRKFHNDTPNGKLTFAMILLVIASSSESLKPAATYLIKNLSDKLANEIIEKDGNIEEIYKNNLITSSDGSPSAPISDSTITETEPTNFQIKKPAPSMRYKTFEQKRKALECTAIACIVGLLISVCVVAPPIGIMLLWGIVGLATVGVGSGLGGRLSAKLLGEDSFGFVAGAMFFGMSTLFTLAFVLPQIFMGLTMLCGAIVASGLLGGAIFKTFEVILNIGEHSMKAIHQSTTASKTGPKIESTAQENKHATRGWSLFKSEPADDKKGTNLSVQLKQKI